MTRFQPAPSCERITEALIQLARLKPSHRLIIAGSSSSAAYLCLYCRGFLSVATTANWRIPCGRHDAALVIGRHSLETLEAMLARVVHYVGPAGTLAVWIDTQDRIPGRKLTALMERLGFRIEAGTSCEGGLAITARRRDSIGAAQAA